MDIEFVRNLNQNYIKLKAVNNFFDYQLQMITRNKIDGLLSCIVERIDNNVYLLYQINSKQPFVQIFERKKMSFESLKALLVCLKNAVDSAGEYLLDLNSFILSPEFIYMNPETKDVGFIYIPGKWQDIREEFRLLSEKLLDWVDYEDERAVTAAYKLHHETLGENYSLEEILSLMIDCDSLEKNKSNQPKKEFDLSYKGEIGQFEQNKSIKAEYKFEKEDYVNESSNVNSNLEVKQTFFEKITAPILATAQNWLKGFHFNNNVDNGEENEYEPLIDKVISYDDLIENSKNYNVFAEEGIYGNTEFFQAASDKKKKLIPYKNDKFDEFDINIFPFIIGKMTEAVDGVIEDDSVSRIHAKIEKADGKYYLVDLNSTNGTFLNGEIIGANEKTKLQTGDRIQFGLAEYSFENG